MFVDNLGAFTIRSVRKYIMSIFLAPGERDTTDLITHNFQCLDHAQPYLPSLQRLRLMVYLSVKKHFLSTSTVIQASDLLKTRLVQFENSNRSSFQLKKYQTQKGHFLDIVPKELEGNGIRTLNKGHIYTNKISVILVYF